MTKTKTRKPSFTRKMDAILKLAVKEIDYFRENPKHLAWIMMYYDLFEAVGRKHYDQCWGNPKYPIIDLNGDPLESADADLVYDAWGITVSNDPGYHDIPEGFDLHAKPNKTVQDWIAINTDWRNRYRSLYTHPEWKYQKMFSYGDCMGWNKDGYLDNVGPSHVASSTFHGYTRCAGEVRKDIRLAIQKLVAGPGKKHCDAYLKRALVFATENFAEADYVSFHWRFAEALSFSTLPEVVRKKAEEDFRFVCYLGRLKERAEEWTEEEWEQYSKTPTFVLYGYSIDISRVQIDTAISVYCHADAFRIRGTLDEEDGKPKPTYDENYNFAVPPGIFNRRKNYWSEFVYKFDDPQHPELLAAQKTIKDYMPTETKAEKKKGKNLTKKERQAKKLLEEARKILRKHQPNYDKYHPYLEIVYNDHFKDGERVDPAALTKAAKILNKVTGLDKITGWKAFRAIVNKDKVFQQSMMRDHTMRRGRERPQHTRICNFSHIANMPDNVHPSYLQLAKEACWSVVSDFAGNSDDDHKWCIKYLKKVQPPAAKLMAYVAGYIISLPLSKQIHYCRQKDLDAESKRLAESKAIKAACEKLRITDFDQQVFQPALQWCINDGWLRGVNNYDELPALVRASHSRWKFSDEDFPRLYENYILSEIVNFCKTQSPEYALAYFTCPENQKRWWFKKTPMETVSRILCRHRFKCPAGLISLDYTRYDKSSVPKF